MLYGDSESKFQVDTSGKGGGEDLNGACKGATDCIYNVYLFS